MEANELRIGNFADYHGATVIALDIFRSEWIRWGYFIDSIGFSRRLNEEDSPKPIPLTEEWLIKLGFVTDEDDEEAYHNTVLYLERNNNKSPFWGVWKGVESNIYLRHIDYVHELQNLFHSLTGEELTIKES